MEVDEAVVDLSVRMSPINVSAPQQYVNNIINEPLTTNSRRILRPRTEPRSYVESPDMMINGLAEINKTNGKEEFSTDSSDCEMPPITTIKEMTPGEIMERDKCLKRLREELRAEEMKLVLLKKLKQSQQLKENVSLLPPSIPPSALPPTGLPSGLSITPTTIKGPVNKPMPQSTLSRHPLPHKGSSQLVIPPMLKGQQQAKLSSHSTSVNPVVNVRTTSNLSVPQPPRNYRNSSGFPAGVKELSPSVTITPAPPQSIKNERMGGVDNNKVVNSVPSMSNKIDQERSRDDNQTTAQRQAAAKLALRKQLEKTLLQIPPPKPPPPEMHFIPNPSNTEFIYLVGLEHVVDALTRDTKVPPPQAVPFTCSQCNSDFTPVWKWDKIKGKGRVIICEQCVTNNVKKNLKAEHTNRLKTAFVKALQQEQEIEQRLAQNGSFTSSSPAPSPEATTTPTPKAVTPTPVMRHTTTPPARPQTQATPPPPRNSHSILPPQDKFATPNAAVQALQQQILRSLSAGGPPAHMMQFSPLFYPYQLAAMAQAAASNKNSSSNLADIQQRAADIHRQYLLDMIPGPGQRHNWKT